MNPSPSSADVARQRKASEPSAGRRLPPWLRVNLPKGVKQSAFNRTQTVVRHDALNTVCEEARCPNVHDCWSRGTATFMIAGSECTRGCRFCSVQTLRAPSAPDPDEPRRLAEAALSMDLDHIVITVVNRDDLPDGGASHYRQCVEAVADRAPKITIELLSSDLDGNEAALADMLDGIRLDVFAHNVECVERLDSEVRDRRASFEKSLDVLCRAKRIRPDLFTKSSIMVGLGENDAEITEAMRRLRDANVDMLTLGQYLPPGRPGDRFVPVDRFVPPDRFQAWATEALDLGFLAVASGPLVRSSYRAGKLLEEAKAASDSRPLTVLKNEY